MAAFVQLMDSAQVRHNPGQYFQGYASYLYLIRRRPSLLAPNEGGRVVYVPLFSGSLAVTCWVSGSSACSPPFNEVERRVIDMAHASPLWQRAQGADFLFVAEHPHAQQTHFSRIANATLLSIDPLLIQRDHPTLFRADRVVLMPLVVSSPPWFLRRETRDAHTPAHRTTFLTYYGRFHVAQADTRSRLLTELAQRSSSSSSVTMRIAEEFMERDAYVRILLSSQFCLSPEGDFGLQASRTYDAIVAGCVPVLVSDRMPLPFVRELIGPEDYVIRLPSSVTVDALLQRLHSVSPDQLRYIQGRLRSIAHFYTVDPARYLSSALPAGHPSAPVSCDENDLDAMDAVWYEVCMKRVLSS
jgi:hypothetical protein